MLPEKKRIKIGLWNVYRAIFLLPSLCLFREVVKTELMCINNLEKSLFIYSKWSSLGPHVIITLLFALFFTHANNISPLPYGQSG